MREFGIMTLFLPVIKIFKTINRWYLNGTNYAQTLRAWLKNFDDHQDTIKTLDFGMELWQI